LNRRLRPKGGLFSSLIFRRIIAFCFDFLVFALPCAGLAVAARLILGKLSIENTFWITFSLALMGPIGFFLRDLSGQSPGKRLMGLRIVKVDGTENVPALRLFFRHVTLGLWPVELHFLIRSGGEMRLGDRIMETKVIRI